MFQISSDGIPGSPREPCLLQCPGEPPFESVSIDGKELKYFGTGEDKALWGSREHRGIMNRGAVMRCITAQGEEILFKCSDGNMRGDCDSPQVINDQLSDPVVPDDITYSKHYHHIFKTGDPHGFYQNKPTFMQCPREPAYTSVSVDNYQFKNAGLDDERFLWYHDTPGLFKEGSVIKCTKNDGSVVNFFISGGSQQFGNCSAP